jgi:hypothetical protein
MGGLVPALTIAVPYFEDIAEAVAIISASDAQLEDPESIEWLLVQLEPDRSADSRARLLLPERTRLLPAASYRGFPAAKNAALKAASSDLVLFLSPPLVPLPGSIERLASQLPSHTNCCGICGQWRNARGEIERGYNIRSFPTPRALFNDLLFVNKLFPGNRSTRVYKMHDFDHRTARPVEHALDYALLVRKSTLLDLGGFDEGYRFGWFDQVEICHAAQQAGLTFWYEPQAVFASGRRDPLLDRLLAEHYDDFYVDQQRYMLRKFGPRASLEYRCLLAAGMLVRLAFAFFIPSSLRKRLLTRYRSYVSDDYIQSMKRAYRATLRSALFGV